MTAAAPGFVWLAASEADISLLRVPGALWLAAGESDISPVGVPEPARPIRESSKDRSSRQPRRKPSKPGEPSEPRKPRKPERRSDPEGEDGEPSRGGRVDILASTLEGVGSIRSARAPTAGPVVFPPEGGGLSICKVPGSKLPPRGADGADRHGSARLRHWHGSCSYGARAVFDRPREGKWAATST